MNDPTRSTPPISCKAENITPDIKVSEEAKTKKWWQFWICKKYCRKYDVIVKF